MEELEYNFNGIVGPTHNYAGLSHGNLASTKNRSAISNPVAAAIEGLAKMRLLADLGVPQAVLPPHERPHVPTLRRLGFTGSDAQVIERVYRHDPVLLAACSSASAMWTANAATVSPSADCEDGRVHFTPANLCSLFHRSIETQTTAAVLRAIFADDSAFAHHDPLPATNMFGDEGAANHTRVDGVMNRGLKGGIEIFVYGRTGADFANPGPSRFPARQTREACEAVARLHGLRKDRVVYLQQNPDAIDAGAFHNDVVAVGHRNLLLYHELAFVPGELSANLPGVHLIKVPQSAVSLDEAVKTYLFNSELVTLSDGSTSLIAPVECRESAMVMSFLNSSLIKNVRFVDVRQSMRNGGGPACLRLRVVLTDAERAMVNAGVFFDSALHERLAAWVKKHYRDELRPEDLADPSLLEEGRRALDELTAILRLGSVYSFQR